MDYIVPSRPRAYHLMVKPAASACNLRCSYCFYLEKSVLYAPGEAHRRMDEATLETLIRQHIEAHQVPLVTFTWQGGEPLLMGIDFYKKALALQKKYAGKRGIENSIQTNGTLINEDWAAFFRDNNMLVGLSLDGPKHVHDYYRQDATAAGTWDKVMRGLRLLQDYKVEFNTLSVVNQYSANFAHEIYQFLKSAGSRYMQFLPVVERYDDKGTSNGLKLPSPTCGKEFPLAPFSVAADGYADFLITVFDEWVRNDVGKYYVQIFDVALANWVGEMPGLCVHAPVCGEAVAVEHNGDVYSCDHFVYPENLLGNIGSANMGELVFADTQMKFGANKQSMLTTQCHGCDYLFACHGGCPKHRIGISQAGEVGHNYLCPSYYRFFSYVHPYMQFMADELAHKRPPANVMAWVRTMDKRQGSGMQKVTIGRNEVCPCGSGRKYKHCCASKSGTSWRLS